MTIDAPSRNEKGIDLGFLSKKEGNDTYGSTVKITTNTLCTKNKGVDLSRYGKKITKVTQVGISGRLKGNVKFPCRLIRKVGFLGATEFPPKYEARRE